MFFGKHDEQKTTSKLWADAWALQPASESAAVRLYYGELLRILEPRLQERDWTIKRQAAACLSAACDLVTTKEVQPTAEQLLGILLKEAGGRRWVLPTMDAASDGKGRSRG
jgi:hypothetical protein